LDHLHARELCQKPCARHNANAPHAIADHLLQRLIEKPAIPRHTRRMKLWRWGQCLAIIVLIGLGCGSSDKPAPKVAEQPAAKTNALPAAPFDDSPTNAQPKLATLKLWIGSEEVIAEIAATGIQIQTGMMFRTKMEENEGMLFVFPSALPRSFWMKNCILPLSCAYIDPEGVIAETHHMKPHDETPILSKSDRIQYVLEMNQGWFERHNIKPGALVRTERGSLAETFFRR
jgi:uncharacterized protein